VAAGLCEGKSRNDRTCHDVDAGKIVVVPKFRWPVSSVGEPMPELESTTELADQDSLGVSVSLPTFEDVFVQAYASSPGSLNFAEIDR
jgi:hypothetical protein